MPTKMAGIILDSDQINRGISKSFVRLPDEDQAHFLARVSHLHHQDQNIRQIGNLSSVRNLTVLYLYDNRIEKIERLESVPHLQMLYLQRNKISQIENLGHLKKLKKLYLSGNRISVVENLESLHALKELHLDHQQLEPHQNLVFHPRSCIGLSSSLQVLNAANTKMLTLSPLDECKQLIKLDVSGNEIADLNGLTSEVLAKMHQLQDLDIRGNPISKKLRHWEKLLGTCQSLSILNGREVQTNSRIMMKNLSEKKWRSEQ